MTLTGTQVLLAMVIASTLSLVLGQGAPSVCTDDDLNKQFCKDCKTAVRCAAGTPEPVDLATCTSGQACALVLGRFAVCQDIEDTPCACGSTPAQCDPYDPDSVYLCLSGGTTFVTSCTETEPPGTCIEGKCEEAPTEVATQSPDEICAEAAGVTGFVPVTPECSTAVYCVAGISVGPPTEACEPGEYFDIEDVECLAAPPAPCPADCLTGACGDKGDCSKWYICNEGVVIAEQTCTDPSPEFSVDTFSCVAVDTGSCSKNVGCDFDLTTLPSTSTDTPSSSSTPTSSPTTPSTEETTPTSSPSTPTSTPSTPSSSPSTPSSSPTSSSTSSTSSRPSTCSAANIGQRYPFAGNCKKYQSCRLVDTNTYQYVESTCIGLLVFNEATGFCDIRANVPGCVPPS